MYRACTAWRDRSPLPPPSPATQVVREGNDNRPRLPFGARPLTFPRRLLGPKLAKSPSAASGAVIQQRRRGGGGEGAGTRSGKGHGEPRAPPEPGFGTRRATAGSRDGGGRLPFLLFGELRLLRALARSSSIAAAISGLSSPLYQTRSSSPGAIGCGERRDRRRANQSGVC